MQGVVKARGFIAFSALTGALLGLVGISPSDAAIVTYTDRALFQAALAPGSYTESNMYGPYPRYSGGSGLTYTIAATGGAYPVNGTINSDLSTSGTYNPPTNLSGSTLDFNFGPGIRAFGGYLYREDFNNSSVAGAFTVSLVNGAGVFNTTETSLNRTTFYGFISDSDLLSASINASRDYAAAGSVTVGTATSVPGPLPLMGVATALGFCRRLRSRIANASPRV